jgi:hypothetical protein
VGGVVEVVENWNRSPTVLPLPIQSIRNLIRLPRLLLTRIQVRREVLVFPAEGGEHCRRGGGPFEVHPSMVMKSNLVRRGVPRDRAGGSERHVEAAGLESVEALLELLPLFRAAQCQGGVQPR